MHDNNQDEFEDQFEVWLEQIAEFLKAEDSETGEPHRPPDPRTAFGPGFVGALTPARIPPLQSAEFARQIAAVLRDEFIADVAVRGSTIRVILPDRVFVLKVGKA